LVTTTQAPVGSTTNKIFKKSSAAVWSTSTKPPPSTTTIALRPVQLPIEAGSPNWPLWLIILVASTTLLLAVTIFAVVWRRRQKAFFDEEAPGPRNADTNERVSDEEEEGDQDEGVGHVQPSAPVRPQDSFSMTTETSLYTDTVSVFWNGRPISSQPDQPRRYPIRSITTTTIGTFI
jgi:hypothetical protein